MSPFEAAAKEHQARFRIESPTITDYPWLLLEGFEEKNLYRTLRRESARQFFAERRIPWWRMVYDVRGGWGPTRNMASSQIACVNFLLPLRDVPKALAAVVQAIDEDVQDIASIRHEGNESMVEFEWIGCERSLEGGTGRGALNTSIDAFMVAETGTGRRAYLIEWKYVENYGTLKGGTAENKGRGDKGETRRQRYSTLYHASDSSFNGDIPMDELLYEPFYQIVRLRLLGDRMVKERELGVTGAKVVVVVPEANTAFRNTITSPPLRKRFPGLDTVEDVVRATLKEPDKAFAMVSERKLLDAVERECGDDAVVSEWADYYRERYCTDELS